MATSNKKIKYKNILITGGAGFVGSNFAIKLKHAHPAVNIIALDNLKSRGSELNLPRLREASVQFIHGDIRNKEDLEIGIKIDLLIDCSAEPSVMAGINSSPEYTINTNLFGTVNCLELARRNGADFLFLSTSRIYPTAELNQLSYKEEKERFVLSDKQDLPGVSAAGVSEDFPLRDPGSLYGTTKLASELLIREYINSYKMRAVINRCGVITGPWQMGKVDQGVIVLWLAHHIFGKPLSYIGFGGAGKQVRDFLHIDDLFDLINIQLQDFSKFNGQVYNVGGGLKNSVSLRELTAWCENVTGKKIKIDSVKDDRPNDVRIYMTDYTKIHKASGWSPKRGVEETLTDIKNWILANSAALKEILG